MAVIYMVVIAIAVLGLILDAKTRRGDDDEERPLPTAD